MKARISSSSNHFLDTNVVLRHANDDSGEFASDVARILAEATGTAPSRKLWVSHVLFGELREKSFKSGRFKDVTELARYIRSIATVVTPDPSAMLRVARLRNFDWSRPPSKKAKQEKPRCMTLGDAIHLVSALLVKEAHGVSDLEFMTFDNSAGKTVETDPGTKALPILSLEDFTHGISGDPDVFAVMGLPRLRPILKQISLDI